MAGVRVGKCREERGVKGEAVGKDQEVDESSCSDPMLEERSLSK